MVDTRSIAIAAVVSKAVEVNLICCATQVVPSDVDIDKNSPCPTIHPVALLVRQVSIKSSENGESTKLLVVVATTLVSNTVDASLN